MWKTKFPRKAFHCIHSFSIEFADIYSAILPELASAKCVSKGYLYPLICVNQMQQSDLLVQRFFQKKVILNVV